MNIKLLRKSSIQSTPLRYFFQKYINKSDSKPNNKVSTEMSDQEILDMIKQAKKDMDTAENNFNYAINNELIDGCIYQIKSCTEYYQYLIKIAKKRCISCGYIPYVLKKKK